MVSGMFFIRRRTIAMNLAWHNMIISIAASAFKCFVDAFQPQMYKLFHPFAGSTMATNARSCSIVATAATLGQTYETITKFTSVTLHRKLCITFTEYNATTPTTNCTVLTKPSATEFTGHQSSATSTNNLEAVRTYVHLITVSTIKCVASVTHSNFMISCFKSVYNQR